MAEKIKYALYFILGCAVTAFFMRLEQPKPMPSFESYKKKEIKTTIVKSAADVIQVCYKEWLAKHPAFESGKIDVDWVIQPNGSVSQIEIRHSDLEGINHCVVKQIEPLVFPIPPGQKTVEVSHQFLFKKDPHSKASDKTMNTGAR